MLIDKIWGFIQSNILMLLEKVLDMMQIRFSSDFVRPFKILLFSIGD